VCRDSPLLLFCPLSRPVRFFIPGFFQKKTGLEDDMANADIYRTYSWQNTSRLNGKIGQLAPNG